MPRRDVRKCIITRDGRSHFVSERRNVGGWAVNRPPADALDAGWLSPRSLVRGYGLTDSSDGADGADEGGYGGGRTTVRPYNGMGEPAK